MNREYWNERYRAGRRQPGGVMSAYKLEIVQEMIDRLGVSSVIDYGCGTGITLAGLKVDSYVGLDFSEVAIEQAQRYAGPGRVYRVGAGNDTAEMAMSLDVVMHLPDGDFEVYMVNLFAMATRYVLIYGPNTDKENTARHMFNRRFIDWIWDNMERRPAQIIPNRFPDKVQAFYLYEV